MLSDREHIHTYQEDRIFQRLLKRFPSASEEHLVALAEVWSIERDRIIERMIEICRDEVGSVCPIQARSEAIFELANLLIWLEDRIIEKKTDSVSIDCIDPNQELIALETKSIQERIENTARVCADNIWKRFLEKWYKQSPLIISVGEQRRPKKSHLILPRDKSSGVRDQHFSPVFSNKYWAVGQQNKIRIYQRGINHQVSSRDRGYKTWGKEAFIYSQRLEQRFQLIEGDAKTPYDKLINTIPLNDKDRLCWIAFLVSQVFRTPSFILRHLQQLKEFIDINEINFLPNVANLRRAYECLFEDNRIFDGFYRVVTAYQWEIWRLPPEMQFIRSDDPIVICGSSKRGAWRLIYPMTPSRCFVAGPDKAGKHNDIIPMNRNIDEIQLGAVNELIAQRARKSVIAKPTTDDSQLLILLDKALCKTSSLSGWQTKLFPEFWGSLQC